MLTILQQVLILFIFAVAGYVLCKAGLADASHAKLLATIEVYIFLPCTVFKTFSANFTRQYIKEKYVLILISAVALAAIIALSYLVSRLLTKHPYTQNVYQYSMTVPNAGYMGYALAQSLFGDAVMLSVMVFALPVSFYTYTMGFCMLTKRKFSLRLLIHPVILAMVAGCIVGLGGITLPYLATDILGRASACMAPISMILTGMTISQFRLRDLLTDKKTYIVSTMRLLVIPVAVALVLKLIGNAEAVLCSLMVFAMPCGLNTIVFPKLVGEDCQSGASLACISTTASIFTIPLCLTLLL